MNKTQQKGFTLLELLIVIAILAVLATVTVLVINPVEYLRQARDSQRIGDLGAVKGAIDLYLTTATGTPDLSFGAATSTAKCSNSITAGLSTSCVQDVDRTTDGNGWVAINFAATQGGSPLGVLPVDPTDSTAYQYVYAGVDATATYELNARLESEKFRDRMKEDGGDDNTCSTYTDTTCWYEIGNDPGLNL